ncbi:calcyphosin [Heteronotia binoei]|uniref:calcyphosin n=1 Tax=Heteronotia binoei TaxID=13085 RepID=UPI00292E6832|nr:calcyphosin [Heteronotia binoei]
MEEAGTAAMAKLRAQCLERGAAGIKGLARRLRTLADEKTQSLGLEEFLKGLQEAGVSLEPEEAQQIFSVCDKSQSGTLDFTEFLEALRPPMSKARKEVIGEAFQKLDKTGDGVVTVEDLRGVYQSQAHPKFKSGEWTEEQVFRSFLDSFDLDKDGEVTAEEFLNYYGGIGASIKSDEYFVEMLKAAWKL